MVRSFGAAAAAQLPGTAVCVCPAGCSTQHRAWLGPTTGGTELVVGSHQKGSVGAHLTATAGSGGGTMISWHPGIVAGKVHVLAARSLADTCASCRPTAVISWSRAMHGTKILAPTGVPALPTDKKQRRSYSSTALSPRSQAGPAGAPHRTSCCYAVGMQCVPTSVLPQATGHFICRYLATMVLGRFSRVRRQLSLTGLAGGSYAARCRLQLPLCVCSCSNKVAKRAAR